MVDAWIGISMGNISIGIPLGNLMTFTNKEKFLVSWIFQQN